MIPISRIWILKIKLNNVYSSTFWLCSFTQTNPLRLDNFIGYVYLLIFIIMSWYFKKKKKPQKYPQWSIFKTLHFNNKIYESQRSNSGCQGLQWAPIPTVPYCWSCITHFKKQTNKNSGHEEVRTQNYKSLKQLDTQQTKTCWIEHI